MSALIFDFIYEAPDALGAKDAPLKYGRVDIEYGADRLAEGAIIDVGDYCDPLTLQPHDGMWMLRISVGPPDALPLERYIRKGKKPAVRVYS